MNLFNLVVHYALACILCQNSGGKLSDPKEDPFRTSLFGNAERKKNPTQIWFGSLSKDVRYFVTSVQNQPQKAKDDKGQKASMYEFLSTSLHEVVSRRSETASRISAKKKK